MSGRSFQQGRAGGAVPREACSKARTHGSSDKSSFPSPGYLSGSADAVTELMMGCHGDTPLNKCPQSHGQLYLQDSGRAYTPTPCWTLWDCVPGGCAAVQQEGYSSCLPSPSRGREGPHAGAEILTLCLNSIFSSRVMVSALAITGMMFTTLLRCFMNSRSRGRRLQPKKEQHEGVTSTLLALHPGDSPSIGASAKPPLHITLLLPL